MYFSISSGALGWLNQKQQAEFIDDIPTVNANAVNIEPAFNKILLTFFIKINSFFNINILFDNAYFLLVLLQV